MKSMRSTSTSQLITPNGVAVALLRLFHEASEKSGKEILQQDVAKSIGMSVPGMSRLLNAQRTLKADEAFQIVDYFGKTPDDLVTLIKSAQEDGSAEQFGQAKQLQKDAAASFRKLTRGS